MMNQSIKIYDDGVLLDIPFEACVLFHGRDSIGGLSLGFRLLEWAIRELNGEKVPERKEISFRTAFPGPGLRDAVEMVTRAVTRNAYEVLQDAPLNAPEGVYGKMYFELRIGSKYIKFQLKPGVMPKDFIQTGCAIKKGHSSIEEQKRWRELKDQLSETIWTIEKIEDCIDIVSSFK